jgi:hypothetical protein
MSFLLCMFLFSGTEIYLSLLLLLLYFSQCFGPKLLVESGLSFILDQSLFSDFFQIPQEIYVDTDTTKFVTLNWSF